MRWVLGVRTPAGSRGSRACFALCALCTSLGVLIQAVSVKFKEIRVRGDCWMGGAGLGARVRLGRGSRAFSTSVLSMWCVSTSHKVFQLD